MSSTTYSFLSLPLLTKHYLSQKKKNHCEISSVISPAPKYLKSWTISFKNKVRGRNKQTLTLSQMVHILLPASVGSA